jgi:hypothetical protein
MQDKPLLVKPKELSVHYGFPYQTMLNWSKSKSYKHSIYRLLEKNMITEMLSDAEIFSKIKKNK